MFAFVVACLMNLSQAPFLPEPATAAVPEKEPQANSNGLPSQSNPNGSESAAIVSDLQSKRAAAEKELSEISSSPAPRKGAPPGTTDGRMMERRSLLQQLVQIY